MCPSLQQRESHVKNSRFQIHIFKETFDYLKSNLIKIFLRSTSRLEHRVCRIERDEWRYVTCVDRENRNNRFDKDIRGQANFFWLAALIEYLFAHEQYALLICTCTPMHEDTNRLDDCLTRRSWCKHVIYIAIHTCTILKTIKKQSKNKSIFPNKPQSNCGTYCNDF